MGVIGQALACTMHIILNRQSVECARLACFTVSSIEARLTMTFVVVDKVCTVGCAVDRARSTRTVIYI